MDIELMNLAFLWGGGLALFAILASIVSRRVGAPLLLLFLVLGMFAGEDGFGHIPFNDFELAFLLGNIALAIIIFDGGLGTRKSTFRLSLGPALTLATLGVIVTAGVTGLAAFYLLSLNWQQSLLIGAIVGSTDAAAVFGLLRAAGLELKARTGGTLEIESGSNDPMAIFLTLTLVSFLAQADASLSPWLLIQQFFLQMGLGALVGFFGGHLLLRLLKGITLPHSLYPLLTLAGAMSLFGFSSTFGGSGFLAIYIVGIVIGNATLPFSNDIHRFHDGIAWLSQIGMFLMLGLLINPGHLPDILIPGVLLAGVLIFIARPLAVLLALAPFHFPWRDQVFIGWCGLRGAVPIILALFPFLEGLPKADLYFEVAFIIVLASLIVQGWTIAPVAKWLQIEVPPKASNPKHLSLLIPDEHQKCLFLFQLSPNSDALARNCKQLPLPKETQTVGLMRYGMFIDRFRESALQLGDYVLMLAPQDALQELQRLFAPNKLPKRFEGQAFFGEFVIKPDAELEALADFYDFTVKDSLLGLTVGELFDEKFHGKAVVGDRVKLNQVQFVVKQLDPQEQNIETIGLKLLQTKANESL